MDDLYKVKNVFTPDRRVENLLYPGQVKMAYLTEVHKNELLSLPYKAMVQSGTFPEARADHHMVYIEAKKSLLLLGGRALSKKNIYTPVPEYKNVTWSSYMFSLDNNEWTKLETNAEVNFLLTRSQFGCSFTFPDVYICGGIRRGLDGQFESLDISHLIRFNINTGQVTEIKLQGTF